ncbi:MAG TPA: cation:proton antiporter [Thermoplasmata archaeon]|nr:cation:proton antiporter [Thermoplasmata archaeon]
MATSIEPLLVLLLVAVVVVIVAQRLRFPYTAALVVLGVALGYLIAPGGALRFLAGGSAVFSPDLFFVILLPPIVFEAGLHINFPMLRRRAGMVVFLVLFGVVFTTIFTGFLVFWIVGIPLLFALLLAAILSPTDPIAVVDLFRRLKVPAELSTIVEGESLLNDAVGVSTFAVLLAIVGGGTWSAIRIGTDFLWLTFGGAAVGLLAAGGVYVLHRRLRDPAVETALSIVAAYGSYLLAARIGASGIVAVAIAGIAVGTWVAPRAMGADVRSAVTTFWSVVVYVVNSVIFLAIGLLGATNGLWQNLPLILLVVAVLFVGRALFVYVLRPLSAAVERPNRRIPPSWYNVVTLAGIRGAIPVVLALSLISNTAIPSATRGTIVSVVVGVALVTVVVGNVVAELYVTRRFRPSSGRPDGAGAAAPGSTPGG